MKIKLSNSLSVNTIWMLIGNFSRVLMQAVYFVILARTLGPDGFGAFVGVTSFVAIAAPFVGIGAGNILIKNVSRENRTFSSEWGTALAKIIWSAIILIILLLLCYRIFLPGNIPFILIFCVTLSDGLLIRLLDICGQAFQAFERLKWTAYLSLIISVSRFLGASTLLIMDSKVNLENWSFIYLTTTLLSTLLSLFFVTYHLGSPTLNPKTFYKNIIEGIHFSIGLSSQNIYNDIDKTLLTRLSTLEVSGIFAAANRVIDVSFTPIRSLLNATYPKFFQHGEAGVMSGYIYTKKILPFALIYSLFVGLVLFLIAPILPLVLGPEFETSIVIVKWLCVIPLLKTIHYFAADTITGAGHQGIRSLIQVLIALVSIVLNILLIPELSWLGSAYSGIISNALLCVLLWYQVFYLIRKEKKYKVRELHA